MKPLSLSITIILAAILFCYGQAKQQPPIALLVMETVSHNRHESGSIGFAALKSKQYERFEKLTAIATKEQLLDLALTIPTG